MILSTLRLYNFRSYEEREFSFSPEVTVITGKNGTGKTNILEAIHVVLQGKSFRDSDEQLLRHDSDWWKVNAALDSAEREVRYQPGLTYAKHLYIDGTDKGRFTYKQQLPVVLFEPDHLMLLHGSPSLRRTYLDTLLVNFIPHYRTTLAKYERALLQRNNLLKHRGSTALFKDSVFVWDIALAEHGAAIQTARRELIATLNERLSEHYSTLAASPYALRIDYRPVGEQTAHGLAQQLTQSFEKDTLRGFTSVGPHRDDIDFILNKKSAKTTASRGEVRTIVLTLKYAELELLSKDSVHPPIFLLDDVFSELDDTRQRALLAATQGVQKIITTTNAPNQTNERIIKTG